MEEIITGEEREYRVCPLESKTQTTLTFDVKCKNDAHIALLSSDAIDTPMIEIFIGGWSNTKSVIRFNQTKPEKAEEDTPAIVCDEEYRRFWVTFKKNVIEVGKEAVFIGRGMVEGATSVGPVYPSRGVCTLPYGGQMIETSEYEVLVVKSIPL